jgi:peptide/nickel transport system substrate-binding protein
MKKFRWQLIIIILTGIVVGILLLSEQPETVTQVAPEPVKGGNYTEALIGSIGRLNPVLDFYNPVDREVNRLLYSRLITFDERGFPVADLADSWGISLDGTLYNFEIKSDAKWHDGQPVTSDDILFTVELLRQGGNVVPEDLQKFWESIEVVRLSATALQFKLPEPFAPFLDYLSFGILPSHLLGGRSIAQIIDLEFNIQPVGSGPYRIERLIVENGQIVGIALVAFDDYYGQQPFISQLVFRYFPDSQTALQAYREGRVQGIGMISLDTLKDALAEPNLAVFTARKPEMTLILFNLKDPEVSVFQNSDIRRALYMGINRQYLVDRVLSGQAILADGPIFPGTWAYFEGISRVEYNPERAIQYLIDEDYSLPADGGLVRVNSEGAALRFTMLHPDTELHRAQAESIKIDWESLGVQVDLEAVPYDILVYDRLVNRDYQAALVDLNLTRAPDPDPYPFWDSVQATGGQNYSQWDHKIASEYLEQARIELDLAERSRLYRNFQVVFADELPALPLYYPVYTYGIDRQVQGVRMGAILDSSDRFTTILDWFLEARVGLATAVPSTPVP